MRIYIMTDLEGPAGILNFEDWCRPESRYNDLAKKFLTLEVNAAIEGFVSAGAAGFLVADGHGSGGINPDLLDPRAELLRGWARGYPLGLEEGFDAAAWVGQHAKSRTEFAHLAHTQSFSWLNLAVNGINIGEFGQSVFCASQLGIPAIFGAGDLAFTKEAQALVPGIETVAVKRGVRPGRGDELDAKAYGLKNLAAIHLQPEKARQLIRAGAARALKRFKRRKFGIVPLKPPFCSVIILRQQDNHPRRFSIQEHPSDFAALMNMPGDFKPIESDAQLAELLAQSRDPA